MMEAREMTRMENTILFEQASARVMTRMEIAIPPKQASAREMTRTENTHNRLMAMVARLRTARKRDESLNEDTDENKGK